MEQSKLIGQTLIELGLINEDQLDVALNLQKKRKERLGELLLSLRFVSEIDILKVLAERFRIHYISSDKLASIKVPRSVLDLIPLDYAERKFLLPLIYDSSQQQLSILANTPTDPKLIKEVQLLAQCRGVNAYLAMKPAIMAGVKKFYRGDHQAFTQLDEHSLNQGSLLSFGLGEDRKGFLAAEEVGQAGGLRLSDEVAASSLMTDNLFVETLNIMISLLEMRDGTFRGHSASVARLVKRVSEKMDLLPMDVYFNVVAAYLHNLGHRDGTHYTLTNLTTERDLKLAMKYYMAPVRLIESASFPRLIPEILTHIFERFDGKGFPKGLSGKNIPLGSRIIAAVDAYEDMVRHPQHIDKPIQDIFRELFNYQNVCFDRQVLRALYEVILETQKGDNLGIIETRNHTVMVIDPSGSNFSSIISRLRETGYRVLMARDTDSAVQTMKRTHVDMLLSDPVTQPLNGFQLCRALKSNAATRDTLFVFISSRDESSRTIQMGFEAGADDFFTRPLKTELLINKIKRILSTRIETLTEMQAQTTPPKASVTGSLAEVSIADIVQLLSNSKKTGMLVLRHEDDEARIFIQNGDIINCFYKEKEGETAFYTILDWESGEFLLETDVTMPERIIELPTQNLMLEGFRLLDERRAGKSNGA